ncbi:MAG: hypothetical protein MK108_09035, partial [Mariniblastus sp.]|nr:hypothetical protein [Mariniblastus sp.]
STWQGVLAATADPGSIVFSGTSTTSQDADEKPETIQPGDEIWFVSARSINVETTDLSQLKVEFFNNGSWEPSSLSQLLESHRKDNSGETVLFVHGNRTDAYNGKYRGRQVFQNIFAGWPSPRPSIRFVIWAWNSDRVGHGTNDFCIKSRRAVRLGSIFSATVAAFDPAKPPLIIGYSLGSQVIAKAFTYDSLSTRPSSYRLALIAPVLDCRFSCLSGGNPQPCESILQTVVLFNQKDIVTSLARRICIRQSGNQFRSFEQWVELPSLPLGPVRQVDITAASSCQHSIIKYSSELPVKRSIRTLLQERSAAATEAE